MEGYYGIPPTVSNTEPYLVEIVDILYLDAHLPTGVPKVLEPGSCVFRRVGVLSGSS